MSIQFTCDDKQTLIAYLYGEIEPAARMAVDEHLARCRACAAEAAALGDVRSELGLWMPPHAELDFTIVKKSELPPSNVLRPARWWSAVPVWAQAAAAVLVLVAGAAIANLQVKSGPDGFSMTMGWIEARNLSAPGAQRGPDLKVEAWKAALAADEQLRNEIRSTRRPATPGGGRRLR